MKKNHNPFVGYPQKTYIIKGKKITVSDTGVESINQTLARAVYKALKEKEKKDK